jgi:biotin synthase
MQALCFLAGANSIFYGEKLLTTGNPDVARDRQLFARLGLKPEERPAELVTMEQSLASAEGAGSCGTGSPAGCGGGARIAHEETTA